MPEFKQFLLADTAEGLTDAEILSVRVKPGDEVTVNQVVCEVETAKAAVELPIPWAGRVTEVLVEPGQTVEVGAPILTVDVDPHGGAVNGSAPAAEEEMKPLVGYGSKTVTTKRRARREAPEVAPVAKGGYVPLAKPPVRKLAKELGVDLRALASSVDGVITREDVQRAAAPTQAAPVQAAPVQAGARERRVPIKGVRKATAQAMVSSAFTAPHVTEFLTVDVTPMMELREKLKKHPSFAGVKLTPLAFAAKAVCLAAKRTPDVNASWDEAAGEIVYKDYVHLGIAAATPRGLVVPKIRDADAMSLAELATALEQLTTTAREGKTPPADMLGGTITITNVGVFGVDTGTPIINPGEAAILAFGAIKDMPWVVDGQLAVRKVLQLALSFDHRLVDGQQGSQFLADVGAILADPAMAITY
ncbi:pyruvate dehydrogenase E2 component (dihydrolipoamide acetyltransferase) [Amycolatopsis bartoniae]|uniref:Dihydrolipoamide acetyltransferase component of pyruvate dehydrogenase complex n=1 Tax=Amycolatopsis bartoniae TaxID=941986 RepID=A0A8H9MBV1_9PSEU|nr:dihydrolipoamide acetyltransferase family protein [Amycolatopsis bartoniae]MBB2933318.1 pyruvate dehydrogenase E2 component (dihydrolipoamide acetyltransferase) [Amycolatopsis bartoniae]TVT08074.1 2-oxo acid dehydrogenase subunit E2 [Amycolatopsis bartoniae]GHF58664.1 dihydrolipoamide acetyltransferase component of pyruvate dehydrogenase complex [Amycolatopsis bartoniae]